MLRNKGGRGQTPGIPPCWLVGQGWKSRSRAGPGAHLLHHGLEPALQPLHTLTALSWGKPMLHLRMCAFFILYLFL